MERKILGTTGRIRFDVTQENRLAGNGATYVEANYKKAVEHPEFQQAISMGNAVGYFGHPRRKVLDNGKIKYEPVLFPHEDEATPTHFCTYAAMEGKYLTHEQAFLDLGPQSNVPWSMWQAKTGGFSSRASTIGGYGGRFYPTKLALMGGMDFVRDRSYRYNSHEGVIATESTEPGKVIIATMEYLVDELKISEDAAQFICEGGCCPIPEEIAIENALNIQLMESEIALEAAHLANVANAYKDGLGAGRDENMEDERRVFTDGVQEFKNSFQTNYDKDIENAERIAIECVQRMPRKPHLTDEYFKIIAPSLIKNGTDQTAIEGVFYELTSPFTGYTPSDFVEPEEEFVDISGESPKRQFHYSSPKDKYLNPIK